MEALAFVLIALLLLGVLLFIFTAGMALLPVLAVALLVAFFYVLFKSFMDWWKDL